MVANGFRVTGLFPCDKNIFRSQDFLLASEDTDASLVKHLVLVKTSDQPSFSSVNFFAVHFWWGSPIIRYQPCATPDPTAKYSRWNSKKITSSPYKKIVGTTQKKKMKQANKSKTNRLASNALLGPSKRRKRRFCQDPTPSVTPSDLDIDLTVPFSDDSTEEEKQDVDCV
jgi:hypothetical protein